jgi:hypothetical protein
MKYSSLILTTAFAVMAGTKTFAQTSEYHKETPQEQASKRTKVMTCELGLAGDEIPKVQAVNVMTAKTVDSIQENVKDYSAKKKLMTKLEKRQEAGLREAMTDEHYIYYLKIVDHDPAAMKATKACREGQEAW